MEVGVVPLLWAKKAAGARDVWQYLMQEGAVVTVEQKPSVAVVTVEQKPETPNYTLTEQCPS